MDCKYITIEREYGSGGTQIARLSAGRLGIPCYGQEILEEVSREKNIPVERIQHYEESVTNSFLYSLYMMTQVMSSKADLLTNEGHIYVAEQAVIQRLARKGPAVFLGHCASEALKEHGGVIRVFVRCTDEKAKRRRILEEYGISESQIDAVRHRFDKKRANYYYANTEKRWDDLKNYDIVLDSGRLGIGRCANMLEALVRQDR